MHLPGLLLMILCVMMSACRPGSQPDEGIEEISLSSRMGATPDPGFNRVMRPRPFIFPQDHGPHPAYATEWWYFTGNLKDTSGHPWGYQLTLFRVGLKPGLAPDDSDWRSHQVIMGHFAISDIQAEQHYSQERFSRMGAGLAGAQTTPLKIWLGAWSIEGNTADALFPVQLKADTKDFALSLKLAAPDKPMVLQGDQGFSQKGAGQGNASHYYTYTRITTSGSIRVGAEVEQVEGQSWFDREWSSSALAADQSGWDWFALQLTDGRDLMFYRLRDKQHRAQSYSRGVLVGEDGDVQPLNLSNTQIDVLDYWHNADAVAYPLSWRLQVPHQSIDVTVTAVFPDQEMRHSVRYWEGAVRVSGSHQGVGYLELSGYSGNSKD